FEERVFLWAADHLVERGAGRDHGVDAVFFFYGEVDEEGFAAGAGPGGRRCDLGAFGDIGSVDAVRGGEHDEVGREDGRGGVVLLVEGLLPLAHHAEEAVVDDGDVDGEALLNDGGEL